MTAHPYPIPELPHVTLDEWRAAHKADPAKRLTHKQCVGVYWGIQYAYRYTRSALKGLRDLPGFECAAPGEVESLADSALWEATMACEKLYDALDKLADALNIDYLKKVQDDEFECIHTREND